MVKNYNILKPFFTVVIPTYNCADYLKRALNSVFSQTYQNFEVIVVDNSSTDNTDVVLESFNEKKITVIKVHNKGIIAYSRNKGIESSKGEWIAFLDSDDVWLSTKLDKVRKSIINNPEAILVCHDEWHFDNKNKIKRLKYGTVADNLYESLLFNGNCLSTSAVSLNSEIAKKSEGFSIKEAFVTVEDYEYWIRLAQMGKVIFLNKILGEWHTHGSNYSGNTILHVNALINVMDYHFNIYQTNNDVLDRKYYEGRSKYLAVAANLLRKDKYFNKAIKYSKEGMKCYPLFWKNWVLLLLSYIGRILNK